MCKALLIFVIACIPLCNCYVLVQEKKTENISEANGIISKPNSPNEVNAVQGDTRRSRSRLFSPNSRFEVRQRTNEDPDSRELQSPKKGLENIVVSVDTGARKERSNVHHPDAIDKLERAINEAATDRNGPIYRAQQEYDLKPELIRFRASEKPSLKFEINTKTLIKVLDNLLSSPVIRKYAESAGRKAAMLFNVLAEGPNDNAAETMDATRSDHADGYERPEYRRAMSQASASQHQVTNI